MLRLRWKLARTLAIASMALPGACLPKDTRPEPGRLTVTTTSALSAAALSWSTVDGWSLSYDRFLVSLGRASLGGDACNEYADARYGRVFDMSREGAQKVSQLYALGQCDFGFRISSPASDDLLGTGATEAEKTFMRTAGSDKWAEQRGVSVYVEGRATKGSSSKHFAWAFRRRINYERCKLEAGGSSEDGVSLRGGDDQSVDIRIHGEALFQDDLDPVTATLRFDTFALADDTFGNGDGEVSLEELDLVPLGTAPVEPGDAGADGGTWETLGDYVYLGLVRRIARYRDTGSCSVSERGD